MEEPKTNTLDWTHVFDNVEKVKPVNKRKRNLIIDASLEVAATVEPKLEEKTPRKEYRSKGNKIDKVIKEKDKGREKESRTSKNKEQKEVSVGQAIKTVGIATAGAIAVPLILGDLFDFGQSVLDLFSHNNTEQVISTMAPSSPTPPTTPSFSTDLTHQFTNAPTSYNQYPVQPDIQGTSNFAPDAPANTRPVNGESGGWEALRDKVLWITDMLANGVIIFAGISWMFGNRVKAIELLFSFAAGYVVVRHHEDIRNFFAMI